jgi:hypothetical protein
MTDVVADLRCAAQMLAAGADPIGTAGTYDGYLMVEWPRPWPRDLSEIPELAPVREALAEHGRGIRLQGLVPIRAGTRRVVLHRRAGGPFAGYSRSEADASAPSRLDQDGARPPTDAVDAGLALGRAAAALLTAPAGPAATPGRDVLICTHGRRDRCCGSWGTDLWQELDRSPDALGADIQVWRTSHTGGHRYAATMIVLPEGTAWGFADAATARRVLRREGPVTEVLGAYRGCAGLRSPTVQALERAVLAVKGWALLDTPRQGQDLGDGRVALDVDPDGTVERWEATVVPGRILPVPDCGSPVAPGGKTATEWQVTGVARVA